MMKVPETVLAKSVENVNNKAYDAQVKAFLANKEILARLVKQCAEEFRDCDVDDIANKYIEGMPTISQDPVDREDAVSGAPGPNITGTNTEDSTANEGVVHFDIKFHVLVPGTDGQLIRMIINIEAQRSDKLGYPLVTRGIYYGSRLISAQKNVEFIKSDYGKIKKVYSIWICYKSDTAPNTMTRYQITKQDMIGHSEVPRKEYDLMQVIMIHLGSPISAEIGSIIHMLDVVFSNEVQLQDKKTFLQDAYGIPMNEDIDKELSEMCDISWEIRDEAFDLMGKLMKKLARDKRYEEIENVADDPELRDRLLQEYELIPKKEAKAPVSSIG